MNPLRQTAYEWHGGQNSAFYSFASCGGIVHSEEHREELLSEINVCLEEAKRQDLQTEIPKLTALRSHVLTVNLHSRLEPSNPSR